MDVDVEQAGLRVGDPREGLAVDPDQLDERDQRETRREDLGDVVQRAHVVLGEVLGPAGREADARPDPLDQRGLQADLLGRLLEGDRRGPIGREEVFHEAVGEPPLVARAAQLLERMAALAQARHDPGVGGRGRSPALLVAAVLGDHAGLCPALERGRRHARELRSLLRGQYAVVAHGPNATRLRPGRLARPMNRRERGS